MYIFNVNLASHIKRFPKSELWAYMYDSTTPRWWFVKNSRLIISMSGNTAWIYECKAKHSRIYIGIRDHLTPRQAARSGNNNFCNFFAVIIVVVSVVLFKFCKKTQKNIQFQTFIKFYKRIKLFKELSLATAIINSHKCQIKCKQYNGNTFRHCHGERTWTASFII